MYVISTIINSKPQSVVVFFPHINQITHFFYYLRSPDQSNIQTNVVYTPAITMS